MDGFPLDMTQAAEFQKLIGRPSTIIFLNVSDEVLQDRLKKRGNFGDTEDSLIKRIQTFKDKTKPLIEKYGCVKIDASKPAPEVFAQIEVELDKENALTLCETVEIA